MTAISDLTAKALRLGATRSAIIAVSDIQFSDTFRELCEQNHCGKYNTTWMCPPAVGPYEELKNRVLTFDEGLVVQTVYQLEDSFDFEGMMQASANHGNVFRNIVQDIRSENHLGIILPLGAGACNYCDTCSYPDHQCLHPDLALSSVEAHGIDVTALVKACGIPYNNGPASVSYVGLILYHTLNQ